MGIARLGLGGREGLDKLIWTAVMVMMCSHCVCTTAATLDLSNIDVSIPVESTNARGWLVPAQNSRGEPR